MLYIPRKAEASVQDLLGYFPVVGILGPRQVGKTSLVKALQRHLPRPSLYLDLENPDDRVKLTQPALFLEPLQDYTVILDEIQHVPDLFPVLRGIVDRHRVPGRFMLLGSASPELIRHASESLAGRIAYLELAPLIRQELPDTYNFRSHWLRGGFPGSLLAPDDALSQVWRRNFVRTYLERDLPMLGLGADPVLVGRLWQMCAHLSGGLLNMETLARSLGIAGSTVRRYLDFLEAAYLIRRLPSFSANLGKRLVKSPKLYVRDTGILHQLLGIGSWDELHGHPVLGASWETYVIEQLAAAKPDWAELAFYRTQNGAGADLLILRGGRPVAVAAIQYASAPKPGRGFYQSVADLGHPPAWVLSPVQMSYPRSETLRVLGMGDWEKVWG
ncbi:MAG: ATP-binding protein [Bacteroidia bacterium]|nr:ATP-binding protein [Bacteroidia bacterium]